MQARLAAIWIWAALTAAVARLLFWLVLALNLPAPVSEEPPENASVKCARCGVRAARRCAHLGWSLWREYPTPLSALRAAGVESVFWEKEGCLIAVSAGGLLTVSTPQGACEEGVSKYRLGWREAEQQARELKADDAQ